MKARLPKGMGGAPSNMQGMIKQAQKMQEEMEKKQEELNEKEYTVAAAGGAVECTITGKKEIVSIKLKPEVVDPEDVEMLEDMIKAAVNEAIQKVEETNASEMEKLTGGLNIPGMF